MSSNLKQRIEREIEKKAMKHGIMGTESVHITLTLTEKEMEDFLENHAHFYANEHGYWYEINGNELNISYTEENEEAQ